MRVVLPYTRWYADTTDALDDTFWKYETRCVAESDHAYFDLLSELWDEGETFCIVEHDVVVNPDTLDELAACPRDWCGFPHVYGSVLAHTLGCVKFGAAMIGRCPDAMLRVAGMSDVEHPPRHWCRLDAWLQNVVLPDLGEVKHHHETPVRHLGVGCAHGCSPNA